MLLKIAILILAVGLLWMFILRQTGRRLPERKPVRVPRIQSLARCPDCGVYRVYGSACRCKAPDRPGDGA